VQTFFDKKWSHYVWNIRYLAVILGLAMYGLNIHLMMSLETTNRPEYILKEENPI